jgi:RND family efflux transporter MFP subunit
MITWNSVNRGSLRAVLQPIQESKLSSRAAGIIERYQAEEGQSVRAGDPIIVLDSDQESAEVAQAEAVLRGSQADLDHAQRDFERVKPLSQEQIYSDKQFSDARFAFEAAQSRVAQAQASLALAQVRLANRTIVSPIGGIFLKKTKNVGESVERFETVARIVDISSLAMVVYCDASLFEQLKDFRTALIQVYKNQETFITVTGKVSYVDPIIDPMSGTFRMRIQLPLSRDVAPGYSAILLPEPLSTDSSGKQ